MFALLSSIETTSNGNNSSTVKCVDKAASIEAPETSSEVDRDFKLLLQGIGFHLLTFVCITIQKDVKLRIYMVIAVQN